MTFHFSLITAMIRSCFFFKYWPAYVLRFGSGMCENLLISSCGASRYFPLLPAWTARCAMYRNSGCSMRCVAIMSTASSVKTSVAYLPEYSQAVVMFRCRSYPLNSTPSYWNHNKSASYNNEIVQFNEKLKQTKITLFLLDQKRCL